MKIGVHVPAENSQFGVYGRRLGVGEGASALRDNLPLMSL